MRRGMQLLIVRHAIAETPESWALKELPEEQRPLTDFGRRRMRKNARGLRRLIGRPEVIATSPYARAVETARILADAFGGTEVETVPELVPGGRPAQLLPWLASWRAADLVAVVGHQPSLGILVTWLLSGKESPNAEFKKGGACLVELGSEPRPGTAVLHWLLTPAQLRALAE
jgi:phosphohistidine phosphatase